MGRWATYEGRLRNALAQQGFVRAPDAKLAFLSIVDNALYETIEAQVYPATIGSAATTFEDVMRAMRERYAADDPPAGVAEQSFLSRVQGPGESIAQWLADLRRLAVLSKFGAQELDSRIMGQLIRGAADRDARRKLLCESNDPRFTLARTIEVLKAYEVAQKQMERTNPGQAWTAMHGATCYYGNGSWTTPDRPWTYHQAPLGQGSQGAWGGSRPAGATLHFGGEEEVPIDPDTPGYRHTY